MVQRRVTVEDIASALSRPLGRPSPDDGGNLVVHGYSSEGKALRVILTSDQQTVVTVMEGRVMAEYTYDAKARAAYLRLSHDVVAETVDLMSGVCVDVDGAGSVVGIEWVGCSAEVPQAMVNSIEEALLRQGFALEASSTPLTALFPSADRPLSTT